jgi:hypothetical protein
MAMLIKLGCQMVLFQTTKSQFGQILEGLAIEDAGIFYGHGSKICEIALKCSK